MTRPDVVRWADAVPQPWKNGSGVTRELFSVGDAAGTFDWRVSVADVDVSGAFSSFVGVDRVIVLVEGPAMTLTIDGVERHLVRFEPFAFDGGRAVSCDVPLGPTRDLNVMTRRGRCRATVEVIDLHGPIVREMDADGPCLFIPLDGQALVSGDGWDPVVLDRFDLLRARPAESFTLSGNGAVARIQIVDRERGSFSTSVGVRRQPASRRSPRVAARATHWRASSRRSLFGCGDHDGDGAERRHRP